MTSESEEDFESADEDFDLGNSPKLKNEKECITEGINVNNENDNKESSPSDKSPTNMLDQLKQLNIVEEHVTNTDKNIPKDEAPSDGAHETVKSGLSKNEEIKIKPTTKKLGTKLTTNDSIAEPKKDDPHSRMEQGDGKNKRETKTKPMKLGMKLTSETVKDKDNGNSVLTDSSKSDNGNIMLTENSKSDKTGKHEENYESDKSVSVNTESTDKFSKSVPEPEGTNFEAGDGWELEEEDGFEIPVTLAKMGDDGIQCAQEQMCELDQVEFKPSKAEQEQSWVPH